MSSCCRESLGIVDLHALHVSGHAPLLNRGFIVRVLRDAERTGFGILRRRRRGTESKELLIIRQSNAMGRQQKVECGEWQASRIRLTQPRTY